MTKFATTKMSSKGQIVIPEDIRELLSLRTGAQFMVIGQGDTVILKSIAPPSSAELRKLLDDSRKAAKKTGMNQKNLASAIRRARHDK